MKLGKSFVKHFTLYNILFMALLLIIFFTSLALTDFYMFDAYPLSVSLLTIFIPYMIFVVVEVVIINVPIRKTVKALNNECDYTPMMRLCEEYLSVENKRVNLTDVKLDHCAAVMCFGDYATARNMLLAVNANKRKPFTKLQEYVFYYNLTSANAYLKNIAEAEQCLEFTKQVRNKFKHPEALHSTLLLEAEIKLAKGEYETALALLNSNIIKTKYHSVMSAHLAAQALIGLGNTSEAKTQLEYVIANGNTLYAVKEAQALLQTLK